MPSCLRLSLILPHASEHRSYVEPETFEANKKTNAPNHVRFYWFVWHQSDHRGQQNRPTDCAVLCAFADMKLVIFLPWYHWYSFSAGSMKKYRANVSALIVHFCSLVRCENCGELATEKYTCGKAMAIQLQIGASNEFIFIIRFRWTHNANPLRLRPKRRGRGREHQELCHSTRSACETIIFIQFKRQLIQINRID